MRSGHVQVLLSQDVYDYGYKAVERLVEKLYLKRDPPAVIENSALTAVTRDNVEAFAKKWEEVAAAVRGCFGLMGATMMTSAGQPSDDDVIFRASPALEVAATVRSLARASLWRVGKASLPQASSRSAVGRGR